MKKLFILFALVTSLFAEGELKVVIDLTTGDMHTFEQKILSGIVAHKTHFEGKLEELDVSVVIHGDAYKFFVKDPAHSPFKEDLALRKKHEELAKRVASLSETYDVEFLMCKSGMVKRKLSEQEVFDFVATVPNAAIGLIRKQNEGYAYLPVND